MARARLLSFGGSDDRRVYRAPRYLERIDILFGILLRFTRQREGANKVPEQH
jgi:hypothetical protein